MSFRVLHLVSTFISVKDDKCRFMFSFLWGFCNEKKEEKKKWEKSWEIKEWKKYENKIKFSTLRGKF